MPVNYLEIQPQIKEFGQKSAVRQRHLGDLRQQMRSRLGDCANQQDFLKNRVSRALLTNPNLRCALPTHEPLDACFPPPVLRPGLTVLAADGSQITPSRHDPIEFSLINIGVIKFRSGSGNPPSATIQTWLLDFDELYTPDGLITEAKIALLRDLRERQVLAEMIENEPGPLITLTDGPLELYSERKETAEYKRVLSEYIDTLNALFQVKAATAGYVDKPEGELVGRLLELADFPEGDLRLAGKKRPYAGVYDEKLFSMLLTNPGERSAIFGIQSLSTQKFQDELSLHFFYLNVGRVAHPYVARVEIPAWVAQDKTLLDDVHALLVSQSDVLGNRPYPYVLHRAHEVAVVSLAEKDQLEQMIAAHLIHQGIEPGQKSNKQHAKDISRIG